jgi:hypothetical protein
MEKQQMDEVQMYEVMAHEHMTPATKAKTISEFIHATLIEIRNEHNERIQARLRSTSAEGVTVGTTGTGNRH